MSEDLPAGTPVRKGRRSWVIGTAVGSLVLFGAWYALSSLLMSILALPFAPWVALLPIELLAALTGGVCAGLLIATRRWQPVVVGVIGIVACALICVIDVSMALRIEAILYLPVGSDLWLYAAWVGLAVVPAFALVAAFWHGGVAVFGAVESPA